MNKKLVYGFLLLLFILVFFFEIIPIPVENIEGFNNVNKFIYGGIYWTSGLEQVSFGNYGGSLALCSMFIITTLGVRFIK